MNLRVNIKDRRRVLSVTLAPAEIALLRRSAELGKTSVSRIVGQLVRMHIRAP